MGKETGVRKRGMTFPRSQQRIEIPVSLEAFPYPRGSPLSFVFFIVSLHKASSLPITCPSKVAAATLGTGAPEGEEEAWHRVGTRAWCLVAEDISRPRCL